VKPKDCDDCDGKYTVVGLELKRAAGDGEYAFDIIIICIRICLYPHQEVPIPASGEEASCCGCCGFGVGRFETSLQEFQARNEG
jgi:hypothetical protein